MIGETQAGTDDRGGSVWLKIVEEQGNKAFRTTRPRTLASRDEFWGWLRQSQLPLAATGSASGLPVAQKFANHTPAQKLPHSLYSLAPELRVRAQARFGHEAPPPVVADGLSDECDELGVAGGDPHARHGVWPHVLLRLAL